MTAFAWRLRALLPISMLLLCGAAAAANDGFTLHPTAVPAPYAASASTLPTTSLFFTSGMVPAPADPDAPAGSPARYGDTYTQAMSIFARHSENLEAQGLAREDVLYARAYVVRDPRSGEFDWAGWNRAFTEFFSAGGDDHAPARTSIGIDRLGNSDYLIEVELVAAYPDATGPWLAGPGTDWSVPNPQLRPFGSPSSRISSGVAVSPNAPLYFTSGMLADTKNPELDASDPERRGDMEWQATDVLRKLEANLKGVGLTMRDVFFLRAMVFPDPLRGGEVDFSGWNRAYERVFNTPANPHKPTRTTMAAPGFNVTGALLEVEVYAAFPDARGQHTTYDLDSRNPNLVANGDPDSFLSAGMAVARHTPLTFVSGAIAAADARGGDMKTQALSALETMAARLEQAGVGFEDVIQLRAYLNVGDDFRGNFGLWNEAYGQYFNNDDNPHKPVRTALPVVGLPAGALIEIEAIVGAPD
ncbi:MAG: Rid family hydrolase [Pseudomonadales bacterium]|jgi:enamine deaminase RidA (YjgF/YER057c/UK114 family)|nr:Rid family hydrolase [Pseudomonadales bacterium]